MPLLTQAQALVDRDFVTGASHRNWDSCSRDVSIRDALPLAMRHLLTDAQTSGGLLVSCEASTAREILSMIRDHGFHRAAVVGTVEAGDGRLVVDLN